MGFGGAEIARVSQVHGSQLIEAGGLPREGEIRVWGKADAIVTRDAGRMAVISTADCVPLLLADPATGWIAAVHAGWRGTAARITAAVLGFLKAHGVTPRDLIALFGPSISRDRYEVGPEVIAALAPLFETRGFPEDAVTPGASGRSYLDVAALNKAILLEWGVLPSNVFSTSFCTATSDIFPSYRRDGAKAGRLLTGIAQCPK